MNGDLSYNSNDLQTYDTSTRVGIVTNRIEHTSIPEMVALLYAKADADGSTIPSILYPSKKVVIADPALLISWGNPNLLVTFGNSPKNLPSLE